jgi:hypothetical protein
VTHFENKVYWPVLSDFITICVQAALERNMYPQKKSHFPYISHIALTFPFNYTFQHNLPFYTISRLPSLQLPVLDREMSFELKPCLVNHRYVISLVLKALLPLPSYRFETIKISINLTLCHFYNTDQIKHLLCMVPELQRGLNCKVTMSSFTDVKGCYLV